ncbi:hypothetical protein SAMN02910398_02988 [Butyrivibrio sp. YAB3001]|nr:hypothetical protein SAMN02910398_02988 [Butyrivibrio sp. YAB3001]
MVNNYVWVLLSMCHVGATIVICTFEAYQKVGSKVGSEIKVRPPASFPSVFERRRKVRSRSPAVMCMAVNLDFV